MFLALYLWWRCEFELTADHKLECLGRTNAKKLFLNDQYVYVRYEEIEDYTW